jgi:hypothetical protein
MMQPSLIADSLAIPYSQCASGLKPGGRLFIADLLQVNAAGSTAFKPAPRAVADWRPCSFETHGVALADAGMAIERSIDLTSGLVSAIRSGFQDSIKTLETIRNGTEPQKGQRGRALCEQLEAWTMLYYLLQQKALGATALLAIKPKS